MEIANISKDFAGAIDEEVMEMANISKNLGGYGSSYAIEDDIREHIEDCVRRFAQEELEELIQAPTGCDDDDMKNTDAQMNSD
ncbi:hypothetical protein TTRE_0000958501 [Trichuris trichiura]|uniref:Uncharacterized protein n=1 Tax=Trichuris trichiura TaxID=36087 RepID=A0A077ZLI8_TRITR|nr:hypothetical protein TTRE_0000958501 [Trichuris trichiura]